MCLAGRENKLLKIDSTLSESKVKELPSKDKVLPWKKNAFQLFQRENLRCNFQVSLG